MFEIEIQRQSPVRKIDGSDFKILLEAMRDEEFIITIPVEADHEEESV